MEELFEDGGADLDTINRRLDADFEGPRSFMSDLDSDYEEEEEYSETPTWDWVSFTWFIGFELKP